MKKFLISFFSILTIILAAISSFLIIGANQINVYEDTYYGAFKDKLALLENEDANNRRLVFIGGSALPFGLVSEELEKTTGCDVVNFGLYGALGSKDMLDIAKKHLRKNDVVVFVPELSSDTYTLYQNHEALWKCIEDTDVFFSLPEKTKSSMFYHYFNLVISRMGEEKIEQEAPYNRASFTKNGDIDKTLIPQNILPEYYDSTQPIEPSNALIDDEFIEYINDYYNDLKKKEIDMIFTFSPSNELALKNDNIDEFMNTLKEKLDCPILGDVSSFVYHQYYFYDTNFHLNESGAYNYTKKLSELLCEYLNINPSYEIETKAIPVPAYVKNDNTLTYGPLVLNEILSNNKICYSVTGIDEKFKNYEEIAVPEKVNDIPIVSVSGNGFSNMNNIKTIYLPETISSLEGKPFSGCLALENLYLLSARPPLIANSLLSDANTSCKINVLSSAYREYRAGYTWSKYKSNLTSFEKESIIIEINKLLTCLYN